MRQVVLDTETTGLEPAEGHRIIEIGCVEIINRRLTGRHYHQYLRPDREIDPGALEVHGITMEFLKESPRFGDVLEEFLAFIRDAELIIHNAPFDTAFLNHELRRLGPGVGEVEKYCTVIDSLVLARERHPGQKNSLDILCKRYQIDNSGRNLHGALLDARLLAEVYLAMTSGQADLLLGENGEASQSYRRRRKSSSTTHPPLRIILPNEEELSEHHRRLAAIEKSSGGGCLWLASGAGPAFTDANQV
jgi:DNA polymerase-3 subunit epsilon